MEPATSRKAPKQSFCMSATKARFKRAIVKSRRGPSLTNALWEKEALRGQDHFNDQVSGYMRIAGKLRFARSAARLHKHEPCLCREQHWHEVGRRCGIGDIAAYSGTVANLRGAALAGCLAECRKLRPESPWSASAATLVAAPMRMSLPRMSMPARPSTRETSTSTPASGRLLPAISISVPPARKCSGALAALISSCSAAMSTGATTASAVMIVLLLFYARQPRL